MSVMRTATKRSPPPPVQTHIIRVSMPRMTGRAALPGPRHGPRDGWRRRRDEGARRGAWSAGPSVPRGETVDSRRDPVTALHQGDPHGPHPSYRPGACRDPRSTRNGHHHPNWSWYPRPGAPMLAPQRLTCSGARAGALRTMKGASQAMRRCHVCGEEATDAQRFCLPCGASLSGTRPLTPRDASPPGQPAPAPRPRWRRLSPWFTSAPGDASLDGGATRPTACPPRRRSSRETP
jgi:hypothetical protein